MLHTDNYLKRSYISLQQKLRPDTLFFLGDLFDGGREWKTAHGNSADPAWTNGQRPSGERAYVETWGKRYGEDFWLKEYDRFGRIFYKYWNAGGTESGPWQRGRRIISSLPGNHDLGFGANVKIPIRDRFEVYFGEGNRVDVIGNHTFVSVDAVSLSAGGAPHDTKEITKPVEDFLSKVQATKRKAVARELSLQAGKEKILRYSHTVEELDKANFKNLPTLDPGPGSADLPTVLLTHVPLYRNQGTPCGAQREHWPPSTPPKGQTAPVIPDDRNAISLSRGWQYQNVLSEEDSVKLVSKIGHVVSVFSGDDHDYCEIVHPANKNNAREITVKSMSWAMGVRKPGFLMLSMWNPIGPDGEPLYTTQTGHGAGTEKATTMESHLCLLPDQISILIRYGLFLALTLITLIGRALLMPIFKFVPFSAPNESDDSLLPITSKDFKRGDDSEPGDRLSNSSTSSTSSNNTANLAPRISAARTRSVSPAKGYGLPPSQARYATPPLINNAGYYGNGNGNGYSGGDKWTKDDDAERKGAVYEVAKQRKDTVVMKVWREAWQSVWRTAWLVLLVYFYLIWHG
jgi:ethanolamine phosphate phosphodiesterase